MIAAAIAIVGCLAVLAAWDVMRRWLPFRGYEQRINETQCNYLDRIHEDWQLSDAKRAERFDAIDARLAALEADADEVMDAARKLRLKRLGGRDS